MLIRWIYQWLIKPFYKVIGSCLKFTNLDHLLHHGILAVPEPHADLIAEVLLQDHLLWPPPLDLVTLVVRCQVSGLVGLGNMRTGDLDITTGQLSFQTVLIILWLSSESNVAGVVVDLTFDIFSTELILVPTNIHTLTKILWPEMFTWGSKDIDNKLPHGCFCVESIFYTDKFNLLVFEIVGASLAKYWCSLGVLTSLYIENSRKHVPF